jgi:hypothetical protein
MSIYAKVEGNIVTNTIISTPEDIDSLQGIYIESTNETGLAIEGYSYDEESNKFIAPKPYHSWVLNSDFIWESPIGSNPDVLNKKWDEETQAWVNRV